MDMIINIWQEFYYGLLHRVPKIDFSAIPQSISFKTHYDEINKVYWVDSEELPDFEASGKSLKELAKNIESTIYVYFDVPRFFAKRDNRAFMADIHDPVTGRQNRIVVERKQLERVFAGA